ncbi:GntR family transcriptional regulator [Streptomyces prunicolor]|uniref:GntR family transcriptional regulator n=1 Tax=Streptomyces prunicolor TaxID=67348 RepID=UPI00224D6504|nr:GntR family transcriptional regulator [Streptomyces prunicolor]MCX5235324.1 GntR family transcriptional regulator [Streptomyces prunicolor]
MMPMAAHDRHQERYGRRVSDGTSDDGGGQFQRLTRELLALINDGHTYPRGSLLPTQRELAAEFGVSRDTVQRVLRELANEGWIEVRQGSGARVVRSPQVHSPTSSGTVTLRALIEDAFGQPEVTLDVFTLTSESLDAHIRMQAERIRAGEIAPQRIALRVMLPSESVELPYLCTGQPAQDERLKARFLSITRRHTESLRTVLSDLRATGLVPSVDLRIRRIRVAPQSKVYLLNGTEALVGLYTVCRRSIMMEDGEVIEGVLDVRGLGAGLTHHVKDAELHSHGTVLVTNMQEWFDSTWEHLAE